MRRQWPSIGRCFERLFDESFGVTKVSEGISNILIVWKDLLYAIYRGYRGTDQCFCVFQFPFGVDRFRSHWNTLRVNYSGLYAVERVTVHTRQRLAA
jgi:hypothetical protein